MPGWPFTASSRRSRRRRDSPFSLANVFREPCRAGNVVPVTFMIMEAGVKRMVETIIAIGVVVALIAWAYKAGKREGSRKGFRAGRYGRRRRR